MSLRRSRTLLAAGICLSPLAGLVVAESSGATTPEDTVAETSVAATPDTAAETSVAPVGTGSSQRLTPRPAGTTDAPLGYYEYLPSGL